MSKDFAQGIQKDAVNECGQAINIYDIAGYGRANKMENKGETERELQARMTWMRTCAGPSN